MSTNKADQPPLSVNTGLPKSKSNGGTVVNIVTPPNQNDTLIRSNDHVFRTEEDSLEHTDTTQNLLTELFDALEASIAWKSNRREKEAKRPHPFKHYLQNTKKEGKNMKEILFTRYPVFNRITSGKKVHEYPLSLRLLLLSLSATMVGLPNEYAINPWVLFVDAWSSDISWKELQEACKSALTEFVSSISKAKDGRIQGELDAFADQCKRAMSWPKPKGKPMNAGHGPFCENLKTKYPKAHTLFHVVFETKQERKPATWSKNLDNMLFLFSMMALISDGKQSGIAIVATNIAHCDRKTLEGFKLEKVVEKVAQNMEKEAIAMVPMDTSPVTTEESNQVPPALIEDEEALESSSQEEAIETVAVPQAQLEPLTQEDRHRIALEVMAEQAALKPEERDVKFQQAFHNIGYKILQEEENNSVSTLYTSEGKGKCKVDFMQVRRSLKDFSELSDRSKKDKAKRINVLIEHQAGPNKYVQQELVLILFKHFFKDLILLREKEHVYTIVDLVAMRDYLNVSLNTILKMIRFDKALRGKRVRRWPTQVKKRISAYEIEHAVGSTNLLVPLKMNAKGDEKIHVFSYIEEPWTQASNQIESIIVGGHFVPSQEFSHHVNKLIAPLGADKDEAQTSMMQRFANRRDGNSNECVQCLAYYEKGSESYYNLSITFLKEKSICRNYVQLTLNNCFFAFWVNVTGSDGNTIACRCTFLNLFEFHGTADMMFPEVEVNLQEKDDMFCLRKDHAVTRRDDLECIGLECIGLDLGHERLWNRGTKFIACKLVWDTSSKNRAAEYHGFCLYLGYKDDSGIEHLNPIPFYRGSLDKPLPRQTSATYSCQMLQVLGFYASDKKNSWLVSGMSDGWNQVCSCIICTQPHSTYKDGCAYLYHLREGEFSTFQSHLKWILGTSGRKLSASELSALKKLAASVIRKPLLFVHPTKHQCGGLHVSAGIINHFIKNLIKLLRMIDAEEIPDEAAWMETVTEILRDCEALLADCRAYDNARTACTKVMADIQIYEMIVKRNQESSNTDDMLGYTRSKLAELEKCKEKVVAEYQMQERLRKGTTFLKGKIEEYKTSKKPKGIAEHYFIMAMQWTGCTFQPQHGGSDLTNADALDLLENWDTVVERVCGAYDQDSKRYEKVRDVMKQSELIATPLFEIASMMKSQRRWDETRLERYEQLANEVYAAWYKLFPWQGVFPKMHDMMVHVPQFIREHGFYGRVSEECFESFHVVLKREAALVRSMKDDNKRTNTIVRRSQLAVNPEIQGVITTVKDGSKGQPRGKYASSQRNESLPIMNLGSHSDESDGVHILLPNDMIIKKEWFEVYRMAVAGEVPESWRKNFMNWDDINERQKAEGIFSA